MSDHDQARKRITIAIAAMGGQGGGVLGDWIIGLAESSNYYAQSTSVPGVAQRTGATVYYLELFPEAVDDTIDIRANSTSTASPVLALMPVPGDVDIVVAAELVEAGRAVQRGIVTPDRTTLIASNHRAYAYAEKSAMSDGRIDPVELQKQLGETAKNFICFDMQSMAENHGTVISATLFGALAGSGALPFAREEFENAIRSTGKSVETNLAAFAAAAARASGESFDTIDPESDLNTVDDLDLKHGPSKPATNNATHYPANCQEVINNVIQRLVDYQDTRYAKVFLERLNRVYRLDSRYGGEASNWALTLATAKHLGLWMSYEDTIRVADLKIRESRFERSKDEVLATKNEIVYLTEFMHPRIEEVADTLPKTLGRWLLNSSTLKPWLSNTILREREIHTAKLSGFLLLFALASLRRFRRGTLRFGVEQQRINDWLNRIEVFAIDDYEVAVEIAKCQNLVKGYGDTHERGLKNFNRIISHLDAYPTIGAAQIEKLRAAALADEGGEALTSALERAA